MPNIFVHRVIQVPFFSRIIEIAGGRELFSQSRCKAIRKSRSDDKMSSRKHKNSSHDNNTVWEVRSRYGGCSVVRRMVFAEFLVSR